MEAGRMTFKIVCQVPDSETICPRCLARIARYLDRQPEYRTDNFRQDLASLKKKKNFHTEFAPTNRYIFQI